MFIFLFIFNELLNDNDCNNSEAYLTYWSHVHRWKVFETTAIDTSVRLDKLDRKGQDKKKFEKQRFNNSWVSDDSFRQIFIVTGWWNLHLFEFHRDQIGDVANGFSARNVISIKEERLRRGNILPTEI